MFDIKLVADKNEIVLEGRFDASQTDKAKEVFNQVNSTSSVDFTNLDYISSAGLSILLMTQKRLSESGNKLKLCKMSKHIKEIFDYAGFDMIFEIE